ncbi:hypothetical protein Cni_G19705 [Canna indica]|uniref:Uncharacterized protein n=1 Tax=Canna indica TaxID=4628 RepID=A0AAQ3KLT0_9LILI|nr:hypothetical protein Cni_G19705 [Canna indica]
MYVLFESQSSGYILEPPTEFLALELILCHLSWVLSMREEGLVPDFAHPMAGILNLLLEEANNSKNNIFLWDNSFNDDNEGQGMKLLKEEIVSLMHLKAFCRLLNSIATTILHCYHARVVIEIKPDAPS